MQRVDESAPQLWRTAVSVAPKCAVERRFHDVHQCAGSEKRPVLSADEEKVGTVAGMVIKANEGQAQLWHIAPDRGNVAVVDFAEVALEIAFDLAGQRQILRGIRPFEIEPKARGPRLDVELGILCWAGAQNIPRIQPYSRKGEVVAIGVAAVMDWRRLDEAVRSERDRTRFYAT